jgi:hypothetical protein
MNTLYGRLMVVLLLCLLVGQASGMAQKPTRYMSVDLVVAPGAAEPAPLFAAATAVLHVRILGSKSSLQRNGSAIQGVVTTHDVRVIEVLKGDQSLRKDHLTVTQPAGHADAGDYVLEIEGFPVWRPGEEYILFARQVDAETVTLFAPHEAYQIIGGKIKTNKRTTWDGVDAEKLLAELRAMKGRG